MPVNILSSRFIHYHVPGRRKRLLAVLTISGAHDEDAIFVSAKRKLTTSRTRTMKLDKISVNRNADNDTIVRASFLGQRSTAGLDDELIAPGDFTFTISVDGEDDNETPVNAPPEDFDPCDFG